MIQKFLQGDVLEILGFKGSDYYFQRHLLAMGLLPGREFKVIRIAPLGDPIEIQIGRVHLGISRSDLALLEVRQKSYE